MTFIDDYQDFLLGTSYFGLFFGVYRLTLSLADMEDTPYWGALTPMKWISEFIYKDLNSVRYYKRYKNTAEVFTKVCDYDINNMNIQC